MNERRVLVTRRMPTGSLDALAVAGCALEVHDSMDPLPRPRLLQAALGSAALLTTLADTIDGAVLDAAGPRLQVVANCAVGYHNIDVAACSARNVTVTNTPDVLTAATADFAFAALLALARRLVEGDRLVRADKPWQWAPTFMLGADVAGSRLGLLGFGRIGQALARRAAGFDMKVRYFTPTRRPAGLEQALHATWTPMEALLTTSQHLIVCCRSTRAHATCSTSGDCGCCRAQPPSSASPRASSTRTHLPPPSARATCPQRRSTTTRTNPSSTPSCSTTSGRS